jgi:hypothetical protein
MRRGNFVRHSGRRAAAIRNPVPLLQKTPDFRFRGTDDILKSMGLVQGIER